MLVVLLAAGCGGDTDTGSIDTGSLTSDDLPGLLPDADTAGSVFGVTFDPVEKRADLSQTFEHTDTDELRGAHVGFYRVAGDSDGENVPTGSGYIALALYENPASGNAAMEVITEELDRFEDDQGERSEFDVTDLADAGHGVVLGNSTWAILRWDTVVAEIVVFHPPDTDLIKEARGLAEQLSANLADREQDQ